jgi:hypothetical protein
MRRIRRAAFFIVACAALLLVGGVALAFNARVANHFGYALPGTEGLPERITYAGRRYSAQGECWTSSKLQQERLWPLHEVTQLPTLLGPAHPVLSAGIPQGMMAMTLLIPSDACYAIYDLEGGP